MTVINHTLVDLLAELLKNDNREMKGTRMMKMTCGEIALLPFRIIQIIQLHAHGQTLAAYPVNGALAAKQKIPVHAACKQDTVIPTRTGFPLDL